jgi:hypothetical protein
MADLEDVARIALQLPDTEERISRGNRQWRVHEKLFVWERPLRPKEVSELGDAAPGGQVLGARVEHLGAKEALIADDPRVFFTTSHFDGSAAVLARLERIELEELRELIMEAWFARAPTRLAQAHAKLLP